MNDPTASTTAPRHAAIDPETLEGACVLVTGASGFVGIHLVRALAAHGAEVRAATRRAPDAASLAFLVPYQERVRWVRGDVTDRETMVRLVSDGVRDVIHAAAVTTTLAQERAATARVFEVNAGGSLNLLEAAREAAVRRFVLVSSGGLYGPAPPTPALDESTPLRSDNLYGIAKAASERLALRYRDLHGFDVAVGRLGTAYGPMERASGSRTTLSAIGRATAAVRASPPGGVVRVRGALIARDFLHVDDAVDAFVRLLAAPALPQRIYNVGAPVAEPLATALDVLTEATDTSWREVGDDEDAAVVQTPANARAAMDTRRLERDLGWRPRYDLAAGVRAGLAWQLEHPELLEGG